MCACFKSTNLCVLRSIAFERDGHFKELELLLLFQPWAPTQGDSEQDCPVHSGLLWPSEELYKGSTIRVQYMLANLSSPHKPLWNCWDCLQVRQLSEKHSLDIHQIFAQPL